MIGWIWCYTFGLYDNICHGNDNLHLCKVTKIRIIKLLTVYHILIALMEINKKPDYQIMIIGLLFYDYSNSLRNSAADFGESRLNGISNTVFAPLSPAWLRRCAARA